jgi:hypothetical protein
MKKISLILALTSLVSMFGAASASAANVAGEKVNYTETEAFINTRQIEAFMVDDHTCIDVESLSNYGFLVQWDAKAKAIYVTANTIWGANAWGTPTAIYSFVDQWAATAGTFFFNNSAYNHLAYATTVPSDIKVFMNGKEVVSYHTGREVLVQLRDLVYAGERIEKHYDPVNDRSWINVIRLDANGIPAVQLYNNQISYVANLSTAEAIAKANAYLAAEYNGLKVQYSNGDEWRSWYADEVKAGFAFPIFDAAKGLVVGNVFVGFDNVSAPHAAQDKVVDDDLNVVLQAIYKK